MNAAAALNLTKLQYEYNRKWDERLKKARTYQEFVKQYKQATFDKYGKRLDHRTATIKASIYWARRGDFEKFDTSLPPVILAKVGNKAALYIHVFRNGNLRIEDQEYQAMYYTGDVYFEDVPAIEAEAIRKIKAGKCAVKV
jgi:hypothetical protein